VGVLDVPEDKMPDDFKKLEKQVQEKFSIPVSVEPRVNAITRIPGGKKDPYCLPCREGKHGQCKHPCACSLKDHQLKFS
jgi:hypothetical protein